MMTQTNVETVQKFFEAQYAGEFDQTSLLLQSRMNLVRLILLSTMQVFLLASPLKKSQNLSLTSYSTQMLKAHFSLRSSCYH